MKRVLLKGKILQKQLVRMHDRMHSQSDRMQLEMKNSWHLLQGLYQRRQLALLGGDISHCEAITTSRWSFPLMLVRICMGDRFGMGDRFVQGLASSQLIRILLENPCCIEFS